MPGVPRTPLIIFQKKMSMEMASKEGCDLQDILWAHCHLSHPIVLSCPQPEVPGFNAHIGASTSQQPGPWLWPQVHGHRHDCSKEVTAHGSWDRPAHRRGRSAHSIPCCTRECQTQETTHKLRLPDLVLIVKKKKKKVSLTLMLSPDGRLARWGI